MFARMLVPALAAMALVAAPTAAADLIIPTTPQPIMDTVGFSWDGLYAGAQAGGQFYTARSYGLVGLHAGVNVVVADPILLGLEGTAEWIFGNGGNFGEFFANARAGVLVGDDVLVYALAGTGVEVTSSGATFGTYQLGGGVELALTDAVSVRGQLVGVGFYNDLVLLDGTKATLGLSYHF